MLFDGRQPKTIQSESLIWSRAPCVFVSSTICTGIRIKIARSASGSLPKALPDHDLRRLAPLHRGQSLLAVGQTQYRLWPLAAMAGLAAHEASRRASRGDGCTIPPSIPAAEQGGGQCDGDVATISPKWKTSPSSIRPIVVASSCTDSDSGSLGKVCGSGSGRLSRGGAR
jgi:hypothetical protein